MALMYFKDGDDKGKGKQWMGKTAVRKIVERRDAVIESLERRLEASEIDAMNLKVQRNVIGGMLIGYAVLSSIIWYCTA